jgi:hypothetical protein
MMLLLKKQNNLHPFKILNMHYFKYIQKQAPLSKRYWPHAAGIFKMNSHISTFKSMSLQLVGKKNEPLVFPEFAESRITI